MSESVFNSTASASGSAAFTHRQVQLALEVKRLRTLAFGTPSTASSPTDTETTEVEPVIMENLSLDSTDSSLARFALDQEGKPSLSEKIESKASDRECENKGTIVLMRTSRRPLLQETEPEKVEGIPWLQEAMDTVNMLETRLQELEHVCQSIPLYEQDNIAMFKVLQEMDKAHVEDQRWIEHTEDAVRWATFILEEALLNSSSSFNNKGSQVMDSWSGPSENRITNFSKRKSRSEGALLTLTVPNNSQGGNDSMSTSNDTNKPAAHARVSLALRTRRQLSCTGGQTGVGKESDATEVDKQGSRRRLQQNWGLVVNTRRSAELETTHKDAIAAALRHLKSIEHAPATTEDFSFKYNNSWENARTKTLAVTPSSGVTEGLEISAPRKLATENEISGTGCQRCQTTTLSASSPLIVSNQTDSNPGSKSFLEESRENILPSSDSLSTTTATAKAPNFLSVSTASIEAILSASSQSLQTDLGGCLLDERVYLKQHIQALDQLRFQHQVRYQKLKQGHRQLISDLERFSKELLGSANELTCAQASLVEACELTSMTLKTIHEPESTTSGAAGAEDPTDDTRVEAIRQKRLAVASDKELAGSKGLIEQGIRKIRRLAADCVGIAELAQTQANAQAQGEDLHDPAPISTATCTPQTPADPASTTFCSKAYLLSTIPLPSPTTPHAAAAPVHKPPSSMFVDGIGFQEFEGHLASLHTTFGTAHKRSTTTSTTRSTTIHSSAPSSSAVANIMTTPFMKRALAEDIYPCLLINPKSSPSKSSTGWMSSLLSSSSNPGGPPLPPSFPMSYGSSPLTAWLQRLLNAMERNACEIELWKPAPSRACAAPYPSAFRRVNETLQEYHPLDRFCRDRIVAVCDFYMFLAHLRQGLLDHQSSLELFRRAVTLRQRMACARIGSVDIVQSQAQQANVTSPAPLSLAVATRE
ncbi:hypothetical protein BGZ68_007290 [Mortierella alpina]|nr:hypothetical protein BGZ68_007290 [Mortierella alpina]